MMLLQTILNGTGRLSAIVRRNEYFDNTWY